MCFKNSKKKKNWKVKRFNVRFSICNCNENLTVFFQWKITHISVLLFSLYFFNSFVIIIKKKTQKAAKEEKNNEGRWRQKAKQVSSRFGKICQIRAANASRYSQPDCAEKYLLCDTHRVGRYLQARLPLGGRRQEKEEGKEEEVAHKNSRDHSLIIFYIIIFILTRQSLFIILLLLFNTLCFTFSLYCFHEYYIFNKKKNFSFNAFKYFWSKSSMK